MGRKFKFKIYQNKNENQKCLFKLDDIRKELAHAYFSQDDSCREIHFDVDENWYYGLNGNLVEVSFLTVLLLEIGHAVGLSHSEVENEIMFPWYQRTIRSLDDDDKMGLEALYGSKTVPSSEKS